jgi:transcription-repair coupling factor (superfamily II helicase)
MIYDAEEKEKIKIEFIRDSVESIKNSEWQYAENSVDEINVLHVVEYLTADERINFVNKCFDTLKSGGKMSIISPYWCTSKTFGDLAMQWPPVSEAWYPHLSAEWRTKNNPLEKRYTCDFDGTWGYGMHPMIQTRNQEYQQHAIIFWKEAAQDLIATLIKK